MPWYRLKYPPLMNHNQLKLDINFSIIQLRPAKGNLNVKQCHSCPTHRLSLEFTLPRLSSILYSIQVAQRIWVQPQLVQLLGQVEQHLERLKQLLMQGLRQQAWLHKLPLFQVSIVRHRRLLILESYLNECCQHLCVQETDELAWSEDVQYTPLPLFWRIDTL